ncbi:MAG: dTMP kinase [Bryobacteraceae bacterium]
MTERGAEAGAHAGLFLTFEGIDGCGKTTQLHRLVERLRSEGWDVLMTVEPGGTAVGTQIRRILLDPANGNLSPTTELLLYFAARAQNVDELIRPALASGRIVVSDRFTDSTLAYQGVARGLGEEIVETLHRIACREVRPDLTICIDIDLETSIERARTRNRERENDGAATESRLDDEAAEFHGRVREAYLALAQREPERFRLVDGRGTIDEVAGRVWRVAEPAVRKRLT